MEKNDGGAVNMGACVRREQLEMLGRPLGVEAQHAFNFLLYDMPRMPQCIRKNDYVPHSMCDKHRDTDEDDCRPRKANKLEQDMRSFLNDKLGQLLGSDTAKINLTQEEVRFFKTIWVWSENMCINW